MSAGAGFVAFLVLTLTLLAAVVATGLRARRRRHLTFVSLTVLSLGATIVYAERLGREYDLATAGWLFPFHLALAKLAVVSYLLPVATGIATLRAARWRRWHGRVAWAVLALTVATAVSGTAMVLSAEPLE